MQNCTNLNGHSGATNQAELGSAYSRNRQLYYQQSLESYQGSNGQQLVDVHQRQIPLQQADQQHQHQFPLQQFAKPEEQQQQQLHQQQLHQQQQRLECFDEQPASKPRGRLGSQSSQQVSGGHRMRVASFGQHTRQVQRSSGPFSSCPVSPASLQEIEQQQQLRHQQQLSQFNQEIAAAWQHNQQSSSASSQASGSSSQHEPGSPFSSHSFGINLEQYISKRNERERFRVRNVNDAFDNLKFSLPLQSERQLKRMSKVEILRSAIGYIRNLEKLLESQRMWTNASQQTTNINADNSKQHPEYHSEFNPQHHPDYSPHLNPHHQPEYLHSNYSQLQPNQQQPQYHSQQQPEHHWQHQPQHQSQQQANLESTEWTPGIAAKY